MKFQTAAALLLSPLMVHAQAISAAQPQAAMLQSSLTTPATMMLSSAGDPTVTKAGAVRVSTGIVEPKLIRMAPIESNTISAKALNGGEVEAVLSLTVDATGKTEDLKIQKSVGADLDRAILEAVSQYRYKPATVSGQAVAIPMFLHVVVRESAE